MRFYALKTAWQGGYGKMARLRLLHKASKIPLNGILKVLIPVQRIINGTNRQLFLSRHQDFMS
jgi:hypothetical protein